MMKLLISKGVRVDERLKDGPDGRTPLYLAAFAGHREAVKCLLDHGANVNAADIEGFTPLITAVQEKHLPLVDLLLLCGADPNIATIHGQTALYCASITDDSW